MGYCISLEILPTIADNLIGKYTVCPALIVNLLDELRIDCQNLLGKSILRLQSTVFDETLLTIRLLNAKEFPTMQTESLSVVIVSDVWEKVLEKDNERLDSNR